VDQVTPAQLAEFRELGELCHRTAVDVGERALRYRRERISLSADAVGTKSTPTDVVTEADQMAEALIRETLMAARPDAAWLGEESGRAAGTSAVGVAGALEWVVDPIDGTTNFLYDLPGWAVSIAARVGGESVAGAVHVPTLRQTFTAVKGDGAWLHDAAFEDAMFDDAACDAGGVGGAGDAGGAGGAGEGAALGAIPGRRQLAASISTNLETALIATGFAYDAQVRQRQGPLVGHLVGRVRDIRRFGAASVDLCSVAAGRVDAYFEWDLQPWDLAAGSLIATEAGAVVHHRASGTVVVAGRGIADALNALLDELGD
jgi:myo-inositol-1(or 4)-monophosphatase